MVGLGEVQTFVDSASPSPSVDCFSSDEWVEFLAFVIQAREESNTRFPGGSRYRSPAFEFARRLKAHPVIGDLDALDAAEYADRALCELSDLEEQEFLWEEALGHSDSHGNQIDPHSDFIAVWDKCLPYGSGVLSAAVEKALAQDLGDDHFGPRLSGIKFKRFRTFLAVAEELQRLRGDESIFLPGPTLAPLLGTSPQQIGRWHDMGRRYKFLTETKKASRGKATEFRFERK